MKNISTIILAGGESRRMKRSKAFLKFDDNISFLEKIIDEYRTAGVYKIVLVINVSIPNNENKQILSQLDDKITIVYNKHTEKGRQYSIKLGLSFINESDNCFIQNIDNPFVNANLLKNMISIIKFGSYISPTYKGKGGHPVLISSLICKHILEKEEASLTLRDILKEFNKITIPSNRSVLININTNDDYKKYFS
jgi:molybdenum cofactor cytidylyltransferase